VKMPKASATAAVRVTIGLAAFFTLVDLFGPQAIAPSMARAFAASPARVGIAVNAAVLGMIAAGLMTIAFADRICRKHLMVGVLVALAVPTGLIAACTDLPTFEMLRVIQGVLMCAGFAAAIAYVAEEWGPVGAAPVLMGCYLTGNVAANMGGRMIAAAATDLANWQIAFLAFALLNLLGAALLQLALPESRRQVVEKHRSPLNSFRTVLRSLPLSGAFAAGYLILFVFVGVFTYVNFRLGQAPFGLSVKAIGLVYLVFSPSLFVTLAVGAAVRQFGYRIAFVGGASLSLVGVSLTMVEVLPLVLLGLALVAAGLFFSQAVATAFIGHVALSARSAASGLYLAAYYAGGLCGAWLMGAALGMFGWLGCAVLAAGGSALMAIVAAATWSSPSHIVQVRDAKVLA
jgi:YNFM family putative membrane transporter